MAHGDVSLGAERQRVQAQGGAAQARVGAHVLVEVDDDGGRGDRQTEVLKNKIGCGYGRKQQTGSDLDESATVKGHSQGGGGHSRHR